MARIMTGENIVVGVDEVDELKKQANELFKQGMFAQAVIGYTYAIKQLAEMVIPAQRRNMVNMDSPAQVAQAIRDGKVSTRGRTTAAALFNNRSAAYLKMNKFAKAAADAGAAALIEPDNFKAWLRKATAHKELGQWYECNQAAKNAMKVDAKNEDILAMMEESTFKMGAGMPMAAGMAPQAAPEPQRRKFGVF